MTRKLENPNESSVIRNKAPISTTEDSVNTTPSKMTNPEKPNTVKMKTKVKKQNNGTLHITMVTARNVAVIG